MDGLQPFTGSDSTNEGLPRVAKLQPNQQSDFYQQCGTNDRSLRFEGRSHRTPCAPNLFTVAYKPCIGPVEASGSTRAYLARSCGMSERSVWAFGSF